MSPKNIIPSLECTKITSFTKKTKKDTQNAHPSSLFHFSYVNFKKLVFKCAD